jgi:hypothetical protein
MKMNSLTTTVLARIYLDMINGFNVDVGFTSKDAIDELKKRHVSLPIPVIPAPKVLIIDPIDVKPKKSDILVPSHLSAPSDLFSTHPMQAWVVAIDPELNVPGLAVGSKVYLKVLPTEIFRYNDCNYRFINYSFIICYE